MMANTKDTSLSGDNDIRFLKAHVVMPKPSSELTDKIMMDAKATLKPGIVKILWPFGAVWKPAGVLTAALVLGLVVGLTALPEVENKDISDEIQSMLVD